MSKKILVFLLLAVFVFTGASCITTKKATETGPMGVFKSIDRGEKWTPAMAVPTAQGVKSLSTVKVYRMFDDPSDPNAYYLASRGQGLYYTYDNGDSWAAVPFFSGKFVYTAAVDPADKCTIYASDGAHIYKSEDCARTWNLMFTEERSGERLSSIDIDSSDGSIYGAEIGGDLLVSRDAGRSWQVIKRFTFALQDVFVDKQVPGRIYVASQRTHLYRSDDAAATWTDLREGFKKFNDSKVYYRLSVSKSQKDTIYWISKYGILRSVDAGATWTELKLLTPPGAVTIYGFAVNEKNPNEIYYTGTILGEGSSHVRSTFYKSVDGGATWVTQKLPTNTIPVVIKIHPVDDATLLMGFALLN
ncbi:MAG: hypothetical protein NTW66_02675 [Candidatus Magasanikbacteria bacterium]|nr:hypothetical protein [Candidatus Magasanikbacteria bacterium]